MLPAFLQPLNRNKKGVEMGKITAKLAYLGWDGKYF